jgi:hypothetical protein
MIAIDPVSQQQDDLPMPHVYVVLFDIFEVYVDGKQIRAFGSGGAGGGKVKRVLAYVFSHPDTKISRRKLREVADVWGRNNQPITGAVRLLRGWGLDPALDVTSDAVKLRRHKLWGTDADRLLALSAVAHERYRTGDIKGAIVLLDQAVDLCIGPYLAAFVNLPRFAAVVAGDVDVWSERQKQTYRTLAEWNLMLRTREAAERALQLVGKAHALDPNCVETCELGKRIALALGNMQLVQRYRKCCGDAGEA